MSGRAVGLLSMNCSTRTGRSVSFHPQIFQLKIEQADQPAQHVADRPGARQLGRETAGQPRARPAEVRRQPTCVPPRRAALEAGHRRSPSHAHCGLYATICSRMIEHLGAFMPFGRQAAPISSSIKPRPLLEAAVSQDWRTIFIGLETDRRESSPAVAPGRPAPRTSRRYAQDRCRRQATDRPFGLVRHQEERELVELSRTGSGIESLVHVSWPPIAPSDPVDDAARQHLVGLGDRRRDRHRADGLGDFVGTPRRADSSVLPDRRTRRSPFWWVNIWGSAVVEHVIELACLESSGLRQEAASARASARPKSASALSARNGSSSDSAENEALGV